MTPADQRRLERDEELDRIRAARKPTEELDRHERLDGFAADVANSTTRPAPTEAER